MIFDFTDAYVVSYCLFAGIEGISCNVGEEEGGDSERLLGDNVTGPCLKLQKQIKGDGRMAREQGPLLDNGDVFPTMHLKTVGGKELCLPEDTRGKWTVLIFYRGDW